jgi:hypothetical protein
MIAALNSQKEKPTLKHKDDSKRKEKPVEKEKAIQGHEKTKESELPSAPQNADEEQPKLNRKQKKLMKKEALARLRSKDSHQTRSNYCFPC